MYIVQEYTCITLYTGNAGPVSPTKYWIPKLLLTDEDQLRICSGKALTDAHMNAAQKLLSQQFPSIAGLQSSCLLQGNCFEKVTAQSIQIHNTGNFHWVTTTSIQLPSSCQAKLFDSRTSGSLTSSLQTQIAQIYGQSKHGKICVEVNPCEWPHNVARRNAVTIQHFSQNRNYH